MNIIFDKDTILKEIAIAQEIIATKTQLTILSNVLLIAKEGSLTIKATDIKTAFETKIPVTVNEEGSTTVFCDKFMSIISSLPQGEIEITEKNQKLYIKSAVRKANFQLKTISDNDFPAFTEAVNTEFFEIPNKEFKEMITQTIFSVSDDETRYFMNGVYIENKEDNLLFIATDGKRLAFIKKNLGIAIPKFSGVIVPPKILTIINKRLTIEGQISVGIAEKNIFFNFGNYKFSSILIDGQFPNYERVIPETQNFFFETDRKEFMEAIKRVALMVEQKSKRIFLNITANSLTISSKENEIGAAKEEIPCNYSGDDVLIALNYAYMEEPLNTMTTSKIRINFTAPSKAITLESEPVQDFFHIIMPMQLE